MKFDKASLMLYAVTDSRFGPVYEQVESALKGGVTFVQLREKELDCPNFLKEALALKALCQNHRVPFIINDSVKLTKLVDADGVHVGQSDMETARVRAILGNQKIIGVSVQSVEQALLAEAQGADYLGVGAVFATASKTDAAAVDHRTLRAICTAVSIPVIAIGGITVENMGELKGSGICGIAVISALFGSSDTKRAAEALRSGVERELLL